jgi:hypothetical protein
MWLRTTGRDADVRMARLGDQQEVLIARFCRKGGEMAARQIPMPLHTSVSTPPSTPERTSPPLRGGAGNRGPALTARHTPASSSVDT